MKPRGSFDKLFESPHFSSLFSRHWVYTLDKTKPLPSGSLCSSAEEIGDNYVNGQMTQFQILTRVVEELKSGGDMLEVTWWGASLDMGIKEGLSDEVTFEP